MRINVVNGDCRQNENKRHERRFEACFAMNHGRQHQRAANDDEKGKAEWFELLAPEEFYR